MKKVSVIVPIYKSEQFLPTLLDSLQNQTYSNLEIILVDDESPDRSGVICDEYAAKDARFKVVHKKNAGCSEARNTGLKLVTGEYLTFVDGDDWLERDCIEYFVSLMESNNCQMAMSDRLMMKSRPNQPKHEKTKILTNEQAVCSILYVDVPVAAWNKMYTTSIIKEHNINFAISYFGEGLYFSSMAAQYCNRVAVGNRKVYGYRMDNINSGTTVRKVKNGIDALEHSEFVKEQLSIKTKAVEYAANWHINRNMFNLFWYIKGSGEEEKYRDLLHEKRMDLLRTFPSVIFHSKVNMIKKSIIVLTTFFPTLASMLAEWRRKRLFEGKKCLV